MGMMLGVRRIVLVFFSFVVVLIFSVFVCFLYKFRFRFFFFSCVLLTSDRSGAILLALRR